MAGSISVQDFGDLGSTLTGLPSRNMNIRLLLIKDIIRCHKIDSDTANALGIKTAKNKNPNEEAVKAKLIQIVKDLDSKIISFLIENVTIKDQDSDTYGFWRLRVRPDIPIYDNYVFNNQTVVFECDRKAGRLRVKKIYLQRVSRGCLPTEALIEGPVLVIDDENKQLPDSTYMNKEDFIWMLKLTPRRKNLEERLEEWEGYLKLYLSFVRNKQAWIAYNNITRTSSHTATISLSSTSYSNNAVKSFYANDDVRILNHPIPTDNTWKPDENTEEPIDLGEIKDSRIIKQNINSDKKKNDNNSNKNKWFDVEIELSPKYVYDPDQETNTNERQKVKADPLDRLPTEGLFVNSLFSDELPIILQEKAIRRLKEGSASNPKLEDFIFDITQARTPQRDEEVQRDNLVETSLNDSQLQALCTSLNSPDISLIQGPPGTGKTTVIAELCYQTVLRGGKVLLASQSNLAVDNALSRLTTKKSEIMPIRIGRRTTEDGQDFVEDNIVPKWFQSVKENVQGTVDKNNKIITNMKNSDQAVEYLENCFKTRSEEIQKRKHTKKQLEDLTIKSEENRSRNQVVKEEINLLQKQISILQEVEKKGVYPVQQSFVDFSTILPEVVFIVQAEIKKQFHDAGTEIEKQLDAIDIGEILGYVENLCSTNMSTSFDEMGKLKDLISKLDLLKNDEVRDLEVKQSEVVGKMTGTTDPEEMVKLSSELTAINKTISELKKNNNELRLGDLWRESLSKLRPHFTSLQDILKLIQSADLQKQLESLQRSLQPTREFESVITQMVGIIKIFSSTTFKVPYEIHLQDKLTSHKIELMRRRTESESLESKLSYLDLSRKNVENDIDRTEKILDKITIDIQENSAILFKAGLLDGDLKIDEDALGYIRSTLDTQKYKQSEEINKSKRWHNLQSEWVKRIDSASKEEYESLKDTYIDLANVVGATCTETGKYKFWGKEGRNFDLVIIDEVSKATPPELLMPMLLGKQIILVGDHQQLPPLYKLNAKDDELPVTESDEEDVKRMITVYEHLVTTSYFKEMFEDAEDFLKARLTIQYRMHPSIMNAINQFYPDGYKLKCGIKDPEEKRKHGLTIKGKLGGDLSSPSSHLIWADTSHKIIGEKIVPNYEDKESGKYKSRYNAFEVDTIEKLLLSFSSQLAKLNPGDEHQVHDVALISFYSGQVRKLKAMENKLKDSGLIRNLKLKIGTVDRFQGMESPIVLVSLVSAPERNGPTSFVKEFRRINVAFSRAQALLVIVGSGDTFENVKVEIDHDGKKEPRKSYGEIINTAKSCSSGNYYVRGYNIHE
jgi:superfamily I DNA and/or RNA helicase